MGGMPFKSAGPLKRFGDALRVERMRLKMSQEELAFESGISRTYAGEIERGEKAATLDIIVRLAVALKMTAAELLAKARI
jgi:transcriptional regulator with XRE-family HTH domain